MLMDGYLVGYSGGKAGVEGDISEIAYDEEADEVDEAKHHQLEEPVVPANSAQRRLV